MPTRQERPKGPRWGLYWVSTEDGHEDWFIVAGSAQAAAGFHEEAQGYDPGEARATLVAPLCASAVVEEAQYADADLLLACGAEMVRTDTPRVVRLHGQQFVEGFLQHVINTAVDDLFETRGRGRLNRTDRRGPPS